ncbi:MAG: SGNH/GDSL hydrolase family protein, partial [Planctomycetes bacterium]|nr:SGNH/GDSL hydrolase family protein [Planctomycetota bacterium]
MSDSPPSSQRRSVARGLLFRAGAVLLGLAPFFLAEGACLLFDWGRPSLHDDPFVGFSAVRPLFVLSEDGRRYEIPRGRQKFFRPESFAAEKGADEFRIFCLGGSTVQGRPLAIETSFTTWLEIALAEADPRRRWEVVNCGGVSYASYRLAPILEEVLLYKPDLIVLYTGHNEFLEDRTYRSLKEQSAAMRGVLEQVSRLRTFTLLREVGLRLVGDASGETPGRPILKTEVEALLDYRGGLEMYHRDDAWRRDVVQHFRYNLRRMVAMAHDAGAPVVLVNPVCNLRDSPPFKAQHRDGLTPEERRRWSELWSSAEQHYASDMQKAAALLRRAVEIDPLHAGAHYQLGKCYDALGQDVQAGEAYL